jgi:sugar lactone lactonase YvrE
VGIRNTRDNRHSKAALRAVVRCRTLDAASAGALVFLNSEGQVITTMSGGDINGPWDLTAVSHGDFSAVFFTNVLNGGVIASGSTDAGTVVRLDLDLRHGFPHMLSSTIIGSQFPEQTSSVALIVGPTGVGLSRHGTLYVADTVDNTIQAIPNALHRHSSAGTGFQVSSSNSATSHLNGPLGLAIAPNGDILTVNAGDGFIVETTPFGQVVNAQLLDNTVQSSPLPPNPGFGALFGLAIAPHHAGVYFVDDNENALNLLGRP